MTAITQNTINLMSGNTLKISILESIERSVTKASKATETIVSTARDILAGFEAVRRKPDYIVDFHCGRDFLEHYRKVREEYQAALAKQKDLTALGLENGRREIFGQPLPPYTDGVYEGCCSSTSSVPVSNEPLRQSMLNQKIMQEAHEAVLFLELKLSIMDQMRKDPSKAAKMLNHYKEKNEQEHENVAMYFLDNELKNFKGDKLEKEIIKRLDSNPIYHHYQTHQENPEDFASAIITDEKCFDQNLTMFFVFQKVLELSGCLCKPLRWLKREYHKIKDKVQAFASAAYNKCKIDKVSNGIAAARIYRWFDRNGYVEKCMHNLDSFSIFLTEVTHDKDITSKTLWNLLPKIENNEIEELNAAASLFEIRIKAA